MALNNPRFHVDDSVFFLPQKNTRLGQLPSERFVIVAVMPRDHTGIPQYRIRPSGPGPLRMASESELRLP